MALKFKKGDSVVSSYGHFNDRCFIEVGTYGIVTACYPIRDEIGPAGYGVQLEQKYCEYKKQSFENYFKLVTNYGRIWKSLENKG